MPRESMLRDLCDEREREKGKARTERESEKESEREREWVRERVGVREGG